MTMQGAASRRPAQNRTINMNKTPAKTHDAANSPNNCHPLPETPPGEREGRPYGKDRVCINAGAMRESDLLP